jgi:hypothetical protein
MKDSSQDSHSFSSGLQTINPSVIMSIGIVARLCGAARLTSFPLEFAAHPQNVLSTQQLGAGSLLGSIADRGSLDTSLEIEESLFYPMREPSAK